MKTYKPVTPGRRGMSVVSYRVYLSTNKSTPKKTLTRGKRSTGGRNSQGRTTNLYQGGGVKRKFRDIDFTYEKKGMEARIETVEYDPYRTAFIALACYQDGERRYVVAPKSMKVGDTLRVRGCARKGRQPPSASQDPDRYVCVQRRVEARRRRSCRALSRKLR